MDINNIYRYIKKKFTLKIKITNQENPTNI